MANNPPIDSHSKRKYRAGFLVFGLFLVGITLWQSVRAGVQQAKSQSDVDNMKGQLSALGSLMGRLSEKGSDPTMAALAAAVDKIAKNLGKQVPREQVGAPAKSIPAPAPVDPALPIPSPPAVPSVPKLPTQNLGRCDLNNDGVLNVLDIQRVISQSLGLLPTDSAADVNQDGVVDVRDVQAVQQGILTGTCPY